MADTACPCDPERRYSDCCGRYHAGMPAPSAEALMRARYSAFARGDGPYLHATWHPDTRPAPLTPAELRASRWLRLQVRRAVEDGDRAIVEFVAHFRVGGGSAHRHHETSRFARVDGCWYYLDGDLAVG